MLSSTEQKPSNTVSIVRNQTKIIVYMGEIFLLIKRIPSIFYGARLDPRHTYSLTIHQSNYILDRLEPNRRDRNWCQNMLLSFSIEFLYTKIHQAML